MDGKRLRPQTDNCPADAPANGKPMLEIILEECIDNGFSQFYLKTRLLITWVMERIGAFDRIFAEDLPLDCWIFAIIAVKYA